MGTDILYIEDDYIDAHYFVGTYAGASLVASSGTLTCDATITAQIPGNASLSVVASASAAGTVHIGIEGAASIASSATLVGTPSRKRSGSSDLTGVATSLTVGARLLTETALIVSSGTLSATGTVKLTGSSAMLVSSAEASVATAIRRASFAIGTNADIPVQINLQYQATGTVVPNVIYSSSASLNKLYIDDYKYIIPAETREYIIREETREYIVKE
jgi:hypothetical protein